MGALNGDQQVALRRFENRTGIACRVTFATQREQASVQLKRFLQRLRAKALTSSSRGSTRNMLETTLPQKRDLVSWG